MIKRLLGYLLLIAVALPASAAFDIGQLMGDLARHKGGKAKFVEKKYFAILDKPVVSTGEMTYTAPDRLEKRTLTPKVETLLLDKDILSIERDKQKLSINLANQPVFLPPGGFITLGCLLALMNRIEARRAARAGKTFHAPDMTDCRHCVLCRWGEVQPPTAATGKAG